MASVVSTLAGKLLDGAIERGWGQQIALSEGERQWTYAEVRDTSARLATALRTLRVSPGDRVVVFSRDTLEAAAAVLGTIYAGAVAVPVTELGRPNDIRDRLVDCQAVAAIVDSDLAETLESIRLEAPALREVIVFGGSNPGQRDYRSLIRASSPAQEAAAVEDDDPAVILYSAGATQAGSDDESDDVRRLRGVPHSHGTPLRAAEAFAAGYLGIGEGGRVLSVVRVSTAYGLGAGLLFPLAVGAQSLLLPQQPRSEAIFGAIAEFQPSVVFATPSVYRALARDAVSSGSHDPFASVASCVSGAEDMPPRVVDQVRRALGADVIVGFGLTEAFQFVIAGRASEMPEGSCGRVLDGFDVRIVGDDGSELGANEIGTLEIRGSTVADRYWGEDEGRGDAWLTTSDRFMADDAGNYYHCGRTDDLFKVGGKWVWPGEVERALLGHEAVWECAVVGADDEDGLIKPQAFVVPNVGHDPSVELKNTLREYVKSELAPYKYPRWIQFVDELPKGPQGIVLRYKLRDRLKLSRSERRAETGAETES